MNNIYALIIQAVSPTTNTLYIVSVKLFGSMEAAEKARENYNKRGYVAEICVAENQ